MSYEKVKSISIKDNKVFMNCASNNVRPLYYRNEEYPYFSKILQEQGREAVEIELLRLYEEGSLQQGNNKYSKALKVLRYVFADEYKKFNWRNHNAPYGSEESKSERALRDSQEFKELLKKCLDYSLPKTKYVVTQEKYDRKHYLKVTKNSGLWKPYLNGISKFDFESEARDAIHIFRNTENWNIEILA